MTQLETIGELYVEQCRLNREYDKLLHALAQVVNGEIPPDRVTVDLEKRNWELRLTAEDLKPT